MTRLATFTSSEQLSLDDVLAEFRDGAPPEATTAAEKGASVATIGADPDVIMAELVTQGDVSQVKKGTETHDCPYTTQCEERRQQLPTYRQYQPCHWRAWGDWGRCPIYNNGGNGK